MNKCAYSPINLFYTIFNNFLIKILPKFCKSFWHHDVPRCLYKPKSMIFTPNLLCKSYYIFQVQVEFIFVLLRPKTYKSCHSIIFYFSFRSFLLKKFKRFPKLFHKFFHWNPNSICFIWIVKIVNINSFKAKIFQTSIQLIF